MQYGTLPTSVNLAAPKTGKREFYGWALVDSISTDQDRWQFIVGARKQMVKLTSYNTTTGQVRSVYKKGAVTPGYAIVRKVNDDVSVYANYIQGLSEGQIVSTYFENRGEIIPIRKTKQQELGVKIDSGKFTTTIAGFYIEQPNIQDTILTTPATPSTPGGTAPNRPGEIRKANGMQRSVGMEVNVFGEPTKGTRINGGFTWIHSKVHTADELDNTFVEGQPKFAAVLGIEQDIKSVKGLSVFAKGTYNSRVLAGSSYNFKTPSWFRLDMGAQYSFKAGNTPMKLHADVYNVLGRQYWEGRTSNRVTLAQGRSYALSLTAEF